MSDTSGKALNTTDQKTQAIKKTWTEFKQSLDAIKTRITKIKRTGEEREKEEKMKSIKRSIDQLK